MSSPEHNKRFVQRLFASWSDGDIAPLVRAMSDDVRWVFPGHWSWSGVWQPKPAVVDGLLRTQLATQFAAPFVMRPELFLADGDHVVVQTRGHAVTTRGDDYDNTYCLILRVVDDMITEIVEHCDTALVDRVLVAPPPDAPGWTPAG